MVSSVPSQSRLSLRLGFWAALLCAASFVVFTGCFVAILLLYPVYAWTNLPDYVSALQARSWGLADLARLTMLIFGMLFVVMLNSVYDRADGSTKSLARLALCFGIAFATVTGTHYFIQLTAVRVNIAQDTLQGLEQVVQANPYSAVSAMNMLGWTFLLGITSLFAAPIFSSDKLERFIRGALLVNGMMCVAGGVGYMLEIVALVFVTINLGMGGALLAATVALSLLFRRDLRNSNEESG